MLSCRRVKGPLIFVSVLMHRETNLQVENEETIEAQSARTPKRCWTESNSAFSFACANLHRWCMARIALNARHFARSHRTVHPAPYFPSIVLSSRRRHARACARFGLTRLACMKGVRYTRLSPTERSGKSVGSSPTSATQNREYGWMRRAGRWIAVSRTVEGGRSGAGRRGLLAACGRRRASATSVAAGSTDNAQVGAVLARSGASFTVA